MNRFAPSRPPVDQGREASSGPMNISYKRSESAPYSSQILSGFTTLPSDSFVVVIPLSYKYLFQNLEYNK